MSRHTLKNLVKNYFETTYSALVCKLNDNKEAFKKEVFDWITHPKETRGTISCPTFVSLCEEAKIPKHSESVHPALPTEWKKKAVVVDEQPLLSTSTEKNVVYSLPEVMDLNVLSMTEDEILEKLKTKEIEIFITYSPQANMFFVNYKINRKFVDEISKTSYVLEKTNIKDGKVVSYPYYTNKYVPPDEYYRLVSRDFTNEYCGFISPFGTFDTFNTNYEKANAKDVNKLVVRVM